MKETLLKKEFKDTDINRIRNLVKKDFSSKTKVGIGYEIHRQDHKEGDVWEEDGREWTIKNGVKRNITKLDSIKELTKIPLTCPRCGGSMSHWLSKKMYKIHGFCFDPCTVNYEAELRNLGLYEQYVKRMLQGNVRAFVKDLEEWVSDFVQERNTFVTEQGDIEDWTSNSNVKKQEELQKVQDIINNLTSFLDK